MKTRNYLFLASLMAALLSCAAIVAADAAAPAAGDKAPAAQPAPAAPDATFAVTFKEWTVNGWGGCEPVAGDDGSLRLTLGEQAKDWCGARIEGKEIVLPAGKFAKGKLRVSVNTCANAQGKHVGGQGLQVKLEGKDAAGKPLSPEFFPIQYRLEGGRVDDDPNSWQEVKIPLEKLGIGDGATITKITFQYQRLGKDNAGVAIKDVAFVQ